MSWHARWPLNGAPCQTTASLLTRHSQDCSQRVDILCNLKRIIYVFFSVALDALV